MKVVIWQGHLTHKATVDVVVVAVDGVVYPVLQSNISMSVLHFPVSRQYGWHEPSCQPNSRVPAGTCLHGHFSHGSPVVGVLVAVEVAVDVFVEVGVVVVVVEVPVVVELVVQPLQCAGHSARTKSKSHLSCRRWQEASSGNPLHKGGMVVVVVVMVEAVTVVTVVVMVPVVVLVVHTSASRSQACGHSKPAAPAQSTPCEAEFPAIP